MKCWPWPVKTAQGGVQNVEFLKGEIENIPLPDNSVDVIISNCVINLSADKDKVTARSRRVLKPGGRFAVSDVVVRGEVPPEVRRSMELWVGCIAGALEEMDYREKARVGGFERSILSRPVFIAWTMRVSFSPAIGIDVDAVQQEVEGKFMSAFVRAVKPSRRRSEAMLRSGLLQLKQIHGCCIAA